MKEIRDNLVMVVSNANKKVTPLETIDAIAEAGFKNVFVQWYNRNWFPSQEEQLEYIRKKGLHVEFAHLGYDYVNALWLGNDFVRRLIIDSYKEDLRVCHENGINLVIMHPHGKMKEPNFNKCGIDAFQEIADYAEKLNIKIAFENTKYKGYLEILLDNIKNENVGICFDSGHYHTHFKDEFDFERFKNKIFAVHLHDNDQSEDQHLQPFEGTLDWDSVIENLKKANYNGPITIELCYRNQYLEMTPLDFYKKGFDNGIKLYNMLYGNKQTNKQINK